MKRYAALLCCGVLLFWWLLPGSPAAVSAAVSVGKHSKNTRPDGRVFFALRGLRPGVSTPKS